MTAIVAGMDNGGVLAAGSSGGRKKHRRFSYLTADDVRILDALPAPAARKFEQLVREQHKDEEHFRGAVRLECDLPFRDVASIAGANTARWAVGPGGGRRTPTRAHDA